MKRIENGYIKIALTAFSVIAASIILYFFVLRFNNIINAVGKFLLILKPFIYGIVIAFLLTQIFNYFDKKLTIQFNKKYDIEKSKNLSKIFSIIISIVIMFLVLFIIFYLLIPKMIVSILGIIESWPENMRNLEKWLEGILSSRPMLEEQILSAVNTSSTSVFSWLTDALLPQMKKISDGVTTGLTGMYTFIKDFIIGIVFSVYMVANKNKFIAQTKKLIYTIFGVKAGNHILEVGRYSNKIFNGFFKGKLLDSLIVGIFTYLCMIVLGLPYPLLISIIIGVTNIIPFFGPFIGWIPTAIIIFLVSPIQALYFSILILIIQQIDGNILGPKIVGNTTGISGFWVLFSIILFAGLFGFAGMIIGVPLFAIIYHFITLYINRSLKKKNMPVECEDYINLKYIDETTKKPIKIKSSD